jgi:hypothetical protein
MYLNFPFESILTSGMEANFGFLCADGEAMSVAATAIVMLCCRKIGKVPIQYKLNNLPESATSVLQSIHKYTYYIRFHQSVSPV